VVEPAVVKLAYGAAAAPVAAARATALVVELTSTLAHPDTHIPAGRRCLLRRHRRVGRRPAAGCAVLQRRRVHQLARHARALRDRCAADDACFGVLQPTGAARVGSARGQALLQQQRCLHQLARHVRALRDRRVAWCGAMRDQARCGLVCCSVGWCAAVRGPSAAAAAFARSPACSSRARAAGQARGRAWCCVLCVCAQGWCAAACRVQCSLKGAVIAADPRACLPCACAPGQGVRGTLVTHIACCQML